MLNKAKSSTRCSHTQSIPSAASYAKYPLSKYPHKNRIKLITTFPNSFGSNLCKLPLYTRPPEIRVSSEIFFKVSCKDLFICLQQKILSKHLFPANKQNILKANDGRRYNLHQTFVIKSVP